MGKRPKRGKYILVANGLPIAKPTEGKRAPRGGLLIQDKSSVAESMGSTRPNRVSQATKVTGLSADQMNALDPAELFGMLPTALGKMVLTPKVTGVNVGDIYNWTDESFDYNRHLNKLDDEADEALIRDSKGDYSKSAAAVERYRTHPAVRQLAEATGLRLDEMSVQEIKRRMSRRNRKLKMYEKRSRKERERRGAYYGTNTAYDYSYD